MESFLECLLDPIAEVVVGAFFEGFSSEGFAENGWTESKCSVQTLFDNVWWNAGESRGSSAPTFSLLGLCWTLAGFGGEGMLLHRTQERRMNCQLDVGRQLRRL